MKALRGSYVSVIAGALLIACGSSRPKPSSPAPLADGSDYEIYNTSRCDAVARTRDSTGLVYHELARVRSGERVVVRVPALPKGSRVEALAFASDGSDCDRGNYKIIVRKIES